MSGISFGTWNVNSLRARLDAVLCWIRLHEPDVLCLQETKVEDGLFPMESFTHLGYRAALWGQKAYNGVAILSKQPIEAVTRGFDGEEQKPGRAWIFIETQQCFSVTPQLI